jgi:hypothetical protein
MVEQVRHVIGAAFARVVHTSVTSRNGDASRDIVASTLSARIPLHRPIAYDQKEAHVVVP